MGIGYEYGADEVADAGPAARYTSKTTSNWGEGARSEGVTIYPAVMT